MLRISDAAALYLDERENRGEVQPLTLRNYRCSLRHLSRTLGDIPAESLTPDHLEMWVGSIRHHSASWRCNHFSTVTGFCGWLQRRGYVDVDLMGELRPPRRPRHIPRYLPADLVRSLLAQCPDLRGEAVVEVMVGMGLRCKEVAGLEVADWDRDGEVMLVREGKGGFEREVPVPRSVRAALDAYLAESPATSGPIFRSYKARGLPLSAHHLSVLVSRWMTAAGIKHAPRDGRSAHGLRHTCASDVLDRGHDIRVVQELLGHRHLSSTEIYLRRAGLAKMRDAMEGRDYRAAS